jgi:hypothetical protein
MLSAFETAAVLRLSPASDEMWSFVDLQLDDCISSADIRGLACMSEDGCYVAAVFVQGTWLEPTAIFRESVCNVWDSEAQEQLRKQMQDDADQARIDAAIDAEAFA